MLLAAEAQINLTKAASIATHLQEVKGNIQSSFNEKTSVCYNVLKLKRNLYGKIIIGSGSHIAKLRLQSNH